MAQIDSLFVTRLYRAALSEHGPSIDPEELQNSSIVIAEDDDAGQEWCEANGYPGYTSYASLTDLPWRFPIFADLVKSLDAHVAAFSQDLELDLDGRKLVLEDLWINILPEGGTHASKPYPSPFGHFRHHLRADAGRRECAKVRRPPPCDDDGTSSAPKDLQG